MKSKAKYIVWVMIIVLVIIIIFFVLPGGSAGEYDAFAECLTDKGVKMFGAYWCPHCQQQKNSFGSSWRYVEYVECSLPNRAGQTQECIIEGIQSYPTWEFADGSRREGALSMFELSQLTGCPLE